MKKPTINHYADGTASVLRKAVVYTSLRFYQRSDVLYQLTQLFCGRYLPKYGDRTVDQMVQAARSTKQNIAEGSSDGQTSTETELKLLGIARGSNQELLEDYQDYLKRKGRTEWFVEKNPRFERLHAFCQHHSQYEDYRPLIAKMDDEELANMAICLCHQIDAAMTKYIEKKDREFKGLKGCFYIKRGEWYKYMYGEYATEQEAKAACQKLDKDFRGCFVVPFPDDARK